MPDQHIGEMSVKVTKENNLTKEVDVLKDAAKKFPVILDRLENIKHAASVSVSGGVTKNIGDFNSIRVDTHIQLPCIPAEKDIEDTFSYSKNWVSKKVNGLLIEAISD